MKCGAKHCKRQAVKGLDLLVWDNDKGGIQFLIPVCKVHYHMYDERRD